MWLQKPPEKRRVIVDVDAGVDDAWALLMLLRAMEHDLCEIVAITCVNGNTAVENVLVNVLRILKTVGRETTIPVYKGAMGSLIRDERSHTHEYFHGVNGFGDIEFEEEMDLSLIQDKHAVNAIYDLVTACPGEIELVLLGPLTNVALALRMFGNNWHNQIKAVFIMGGNHMGVGNITKSAEFNFYTDPEAAQIVLDTLKCPMTVLTWETCTERVLTVPMHWRVQELGAIETNVTQLMNPLDHKIYVERSRQYFRPCDALLVSVYLCPGIVEVANDWHALVELNGKHTRGQLVLDHLKVNASNVKIVEQINMDWFKSMLCWTAGHPNHVCILGENDKEKSHE